MTKAGNGIVTLLLTTGKGRAFYKKFAYRHRIGKMGEKIVEGRFQSGHLPVLAEGLEQVNHRIPRRQQRLLPVAVHADFNGSAIKIDDSAQPFAA